MHVAFRKSLQVSLIGLEYRGVLLNQTRSHWNKDFKPGPFPTTDEAKEAAAKKYGLNIQDYKTYPDDGEGFGDYPKVDDVSGDSRDPYYPWDKPELRQNFNEPVSEREQLIDECHYDLSKKHRTPFWRQIGEFCFAFFGAFFLLYGCQQYKMFLPVFARQYPDAPHYYFDVDKKGHHHPPAEKDHHKKDDHHKK